MRTKLLASASVPALAFAATLGIPEFSSTAHAGGLQKTWKPAAAAPLNRWQGLYFGGHIGAGQANWDGVYKNGSSDSTVFADRLNTDGVLGGFHGGFNIQRGRAVFGIEGDISFMDWSDVADAVSSSEEIAAEVDSLASVRGRLGVAMGEEQRVLLFASIGAAWADAEATVFSDGAGDSSAGVSFDFDDVGLVVGAGFEYAMTDSFRLRVDGSWYSFDQNESLSAVTEANAGDNLELEDAYSVRFGGSFYINPN